MNPILEAEAGLTSQNQITIPAAIRQALKLEGGKSRVKFQLLPEEGKVMVINASIRSNQEDPALEAFLNLLSADLESHPARIRPLSSKSLRKAKSLVKNIKIDLNGPLEGKD